MHWKSVLVALSFSALTSQAQFPPSGAQAFPPAASRNALDLWQEVPREQMDVQALSPKGKQVLDIEDIKWKHAQTEHFVLHFEQAIFARKVARMAQFMYSYIAEDLKGVKDQVDGRSHIFIFRNPKRWKQLRENVGDVPEWTFSQVQGTVMFLQQADNTASSGDILAHEMTHLVMNRFFKGNPPLWLNEGIAEYYEEFGYAAFKGVKKSKKAQFGRLGNPLSLQDLLYATAYPQTDLEVRRFYDSAKYLVGFLLLDRPVEKFLPFLDDVLRGVDIEKAFGHHYGILTINDVQKEFRKFCT